MLTGKEVISNEELQRSLDNNQTLEVWIDHELEERCLLVSFSERTIRTNQGFYYQRANITLLIAKETEIFYLKQ